MHDDKDDDLVVTIARLFLKTDNLMIFTYLQITFQVVIASDEVNSFVIINYLDGGIQWIQSSCKYAEILANPPAQARFDSGDENMYFPLPNSGTTCVQNLAV